MLSDRCYAAMARPPRLGLNALSSIVCFLTVHMEYLPPNVEAESQCPLEHCMLSDYIVRSFWSKESEGSQCPLEHCMLSDV